MMKKSNIFLFYGEDVHSLNSKIKEWVTRFSVKSDILLDKEEIDGSLANWEQLRACLSLVPLLGDKRLVIIRNIITNGKKNVCQKLAEFVPNIHENVVVIFIEEYENIKGSELFAVLSEHKVYHFPKPDLAEMPKYLRIFLEDRQVQMDTKAKSLLIQRVGNDNMLLQNELQKLLLFSDGSGITSEMVEKLITPRLESRIFTLADAIFGHKVKEASALMVGELEFGTSPLQILGLLISQTRKLSVIKDGLERKLNTDEIGRRIGVKPFMIGKLREQQKKLSTAQLMSYYARLTIADRDIKSGADNNTVMLALSDVKKSVS